MIIQNGDKAVSVISIMNDTIKKNSKSYPALKFEFAEQITKEDLEVLLSGNFEVLDDNGELLGVYEGFNTFKGLSVTIGKITTSDERIVELEKAIASAMAEKEELEKSLANSKAENVELEKSLANSKAENVELSTTLEAAQSEKEELQNAIDIMVGGSVE